MLWKRGHRHSGGLGLPSEITSDQSATEILSAWLQSNGRNTVTLKPDTWPDPAAWGLLLADIARHIANAIAEARGQEAEDILARIRAGLVVELEDPTDAPSGRWEPRSE
jgi:hypothetical protein